ncbi:hypothetical protein LZ575_20565 [Antarcticibacterium sp. 1MA-6-2]|uniref:hypothetical protein n=1 Tax=Antarcticibacterium sp. 1MA-6-2 TaxID=2908210 RepID=UPI001F403EC4|nr:hypothetical protein [Antarcticibacterium sp. 1MA-6-2]UJH91032.1 hypothetical protein LZ575_20565 [Antarcticibacterium sp. 1MA-6-2]
MNTIKKATALLFLLSFLICSNGNNCTYYGKVETTELVEKLSHNQAAFSAFPR